MRISECHEKLTDGKGKCSVPMWCMGMPAGFCDEPAFGKQEPGQHRYGEYVRDRGYQWFDGYCSGLACYGHGGPKCPGIDLGDGNFSGCTGKGGDCPTCGK